MSDNASAAVPSYPRGYMLILCLAKISEASIICFIMPFINQMVASFDPASGSISRYSGIIESALIVTEAIFSPLWGIVADKVGRKYLLVLGLAAFAIASVAIGLSRTLLQAILARCISGVLGAVAVLVRTVQFEITDAANVNKVLEWLAPTWAIGASIGPLLGGLLAEPAKTMPKIFEGTIFDTFPYLLPSLVVAIFPVTASIAALIWLPDPSASTATLADSADIGSDLVLSQVSNDDTLVEGTTTDYFALLRDRKLGYSLFCSAVLSFVSMSHNAAFMMMASTSLAEGGLGFKPWQTGVLLAISSVLGVFIGSTGTAMLNRRFGWYRSLRIAFFHVILFPLAALAGVVARLEGGVGVFTAIIIFFVLVSYEIGELSFSGVDVAVSDRSPVGCLGAVTGMSSCVGSLGRVVAPVLAGQLWAYGAESKLPAGQYIVWVIFTAVAIFWHCLTLRLDEPCAIDKLDIAIRHVL